MNRLVSIFALFLLAALVAAPFPAGAFNVENIQIHGYGNWYYGKSDGNAYLSDEDGDYDNAEFALSFAAQPFEKTTIHLQPFWEITDDGVETTIDVGFGEYAFSDLLRVRAGIARHPFGIYPEILEVGTLRPFMTLPSGLYSEGAGIVSENYKGIGISGEYFGSGGWSVRYDLYGGAIDLASSQPWEGADEIVESAEVELVEEFELEDAVGARVTVFTPVEGLNVGASAYTGEQTAEAEGGALEGNRDFTFGVHLEYLTEKISLRCEYAHQDLEDEFETDAAYIEGAYMITANVQVAGRVDWSDASLQGKEADDIEDIESSLLEHQEFAVGVNWWFSPGLVFKASYHIVDGNRFAVPEEMEDELDENTNVFLLGASFSF